MFRSVGQLAKIKRIARIGSLAPMSSSTSTHPSSPAVQKSEKSDVSSDVSGSGGDRNRDHFEKAVAKLRDINRLLQRKNKTKKLPFLLNTYFGNFDRDILIFPGPLEIPLLLCRFIKQINEIYLGIPKNVELLGKTDLEFLLEFRKEINKEYEDSRQKICGVCAPMLSNGYEMNVTERASISEDVFWSNDSNSMLSISDHSTVVKVLEQFGSNEIKAKYLTALVNGDLKATVCFTEDGFMQNSILETFAFQENNEWIVNGVKSHVRNALDADIFLVLADTCKETHSERSIDFLSAFLIEKQSEGISIQDCSPGRNSVIFDKVKVSPLNMIGKTNMAINILEMITNDNRVMSSIHSIIVQRKLIAKVIEFANTTNADKFPLAHSDYFKRLLSMMTKDLYASESMLYLGAGMSDLYENMPCYVENSAMRVFAVEATLRAFTSAKQALGPDTLKPDHFVAKLEREFAHNLLLPESTDMSQLAMSYCAIKHSYDRFHNDVLKSRNVMFNSRFNFINKLRSVRDHFDDPKMYMDLEGFLHPTLTKQAQSLEYCVQRLKYAFKQSVIRNGVETIDRQVELIQISRIAVYVYAMTATLARASRSYCIGLQNAELEMFLAGLVCKEGKEAVKKLAELVGEGPISSQEQIYLNLAISFYSDKEYSVSHPLCRNYD